MVIDQNMLTPPVKCISAAFFLSTRRKFGNILPLLFTQALKSIEYMYGPSIKYCYLEIYISVVREPNTRSNKNISQIMLSLPKQLTLRCLSPPIDRRIPTLLLINFIFLNIYGQNLCWCSCPRITRGQAFVFLNYLRFIQ